MPIAAAVHEKAIELARLAVRMTARAGSGHPSSALSLAHLVTHLMYRQMRFDPADPWNPAADRLVLSEGHAVPIVYAAYADLGGVIGEPVAVRLDGRERGGANVRPLTRTDLDTLRRRDSALEGHPNPAEGFFFLDTATGSLGQGLSMAAGLALTARRANSPRRVYCLIGDGESREGQVWEALDFIVDHQLTNVCPIFNCNGQGQAAAVSYQQSPERLTDKLEAFGFNVVLIDGHDPLEIERAFREFDEADRRPVAIVARTIKGWGVDLLQHGNWHGKPPSVAQLDQAEQSLDAQRDKLLGSGPAPAALGGPRRPPTVSPASHPDPTHLVWPGFAEALRGVGLAEALDKGRIATRLAYGAALKVAGDLLPHVYVLDGDVSNSTYSNIFAKYHAERFIECKIAEQNMVSVAVGLAAAGNIPFVNSFAKFLARAYDQVEMASLSRANLKLVGSHAGISPAADGPSQMGLLDVAYFRGFTTVRGDDRSSPLCWLFQPADGVAAYHCTRLLTQLPGLCYMRTHRPAVPLIYSPDTVFEPGGFHLLRPGEDLALLSAGYMVHAALEAAELLARQRLRAAVIDVYSLPLRAEPLLELLHRCGGRALVVEDNYGALGAAVAEAAARPGNVRIAALCCQRIPKSALEPTDELEYCGLGPGQIADHARALLHSPR